MSIGRQMGAWMLANPLAAQARLALSRGDLSDARAALAEARRLLRPAGLQWFGPVLIPLLEADLRLAEGEAGLALSILIDLKLKVAAMPVRPFLPEVLRLEAAALDRSGRSAEAVEALRQARLEAQTMGASWRLLPVLVDLSRVLERAGDHAASGDALTEAKTVGRQIMDHIPQDTGWIPYKDQSDVQAVLGGIVRKARPGAGPSSK